MYTKLLKQSMNEMVISKNFGATALFKYHFMLVKIEKSEQESEKRCKCWVRNEKCSSVLIKVNELATKMLSMNVFFVWWQLTIRLQYI